MHATQGATHGVGPCCHTLMISPWAGTLCTGVVVVHVATMRAAVIPVVKMLDLCGGLATWILVADAVSAAVCATATIVAAAAIHVLVATVVVTAAAAAIWVLVATAATVVVTTTTVVSVATVAAASTVVATSLLSTAASATWALLVVDDARRGLTISNGLAEHFELSMDCHDAGRVGSE